ASKLKLTQTRVIAADDGVVSSKSAVLGNVVNAGAELFRLVRQGRIEWRPELDAREISAVRPGQSARITLPSGESVTGTVRIVAPTSSADSARAIVYVSLPKQSAARAGVFASGTIELESTSALTLPQSAIVLRDGRAYVYVLEAGDKVASRVVTTGRRKDERVEVLAGIDDNTRIVASGGAFLSEGAQVTVAAVPTIQARAERAQ
ncbi:MAG TPA: efflux RND transporter periplasmic adaptor subunit, partial [Steroidobacter sp.]